MGLDPDLYSVARPEQRIYVYMKSIQEDVARLKTRTEEGQLQDSLSTAPATSTAGNGTEVFRTAGPLCSGPPAFADGALAIGHIMEQQSNETSHEESYTGFGPILHPWIEITYTQTLTIRPISHSGRDNFSVNRLLQGPNSLIRIPTTSR